MDNTDNGVPDSAPPAPESQRLYVLPPFSNDVKLADVRMRDACILPDPVTQTYYIVASAYNGVRAYTSKDLRVWAGPHMIFETPEGFWRGVDMRGIAGDGL